MLGIIRFLPLGPQGYMLIIKSLVCGAHNTPINHTSRNPTVKPFKAQQFKSVDFFFESQ